MHRRDSTATSMPFRFIPTVAVVLATFASPGAGAASLDADSAKARRDAPASERNTGRVSSNLGSLFAGDRRGDALARAATAHGIRTAGDRVLVDIALRSRPDDLEQRLRDAGAEVHAISERHLRASVSIANLSEAETIGALPEVLWVRPEYGARSRVGSVTSRAVDALRVTEVASAPDNLTGNGRRIGLLSDSFARTDNVVDGDTTAEDSGNATPLILKNSIPQDSDDLPSEVELRRDDASGTVIDEGAAMGELVHDIAPGADIAFHTVGNNVAAFADAIDDLCTSRGNGGAGADVAVDDILFFAELMYQPDIVSLAASECVAAGVSYFSAAGNDGDTAFRQTYVDSDPNDNDDSDTDADGDGEPEGSPFGDFHDWNSGGDAADPALGIQLDPGESFRAVLQWNQPALSVPDNASNGPQIDLDLLLFDSGGNVIESSFDNQRAGDSDAGLDPFEFITYTNNSSATEVVQVGIDHWAGSRDTIPQETNTDLEFRLVFFEDGSLDYEYAPGGPAIYGHPVAEGVMSVGAVPWWETPAFDPSLGPTDDIDPEPFTSRGGHIPRSFDADGSFNLTFDFAPDIAAVDGNNTTFFGQSSTNLPEEIPGEPDGFPNFFGTSASAPNAAAVTALLLEKESALAPDDIAAKLMTSSVDVTGEGAAVGCDDRTGAGLIDAAAAVPATDEAPTARAGSDQETKSGRTVTLDGTASTDNNGIDQFRWTQVKGSRVSLSDPDSEKTSFTAPKSGGSLVFELRVSDSACLADTDRVAVDVESRGGGGGGSFGWLLLAGLLYPVRRRFHGHGGNIRMMAALSVLPRL